VKTYVLDPAELGLPPASLADLQAQDIDENAAIVRSVLGGEPGARRDVVLLNAAAAMKVGGLARDMAEGLDLAAASIDRGAAGGVLERLVAFTNGAGRQ
jgi:anthranilate phosphoribosyltransferase